MSCSNLNLSSSAGVRVGVLDLSAAYSWYLSAESFAKSSAFFFLSSGHGCGSRAMAIISLKLSAGRKAYCWRSFSTPMLCCFSASRSLARSASSLNFELRVLMLTMATLIAGPSAWAGVARATRPPARESTSTPNTKRLIMSRFSLRALRLLTVSLDSPRYLWLRTYRSPYDDVFSLR